MYIKERRHKMSDLVLKMASKSGSDLTFNHSSDYLMQLDQPVEYAANDKVYIVGSPNNESISRVTNTVKESGEVWILQEYVSNLESEESSTQKCHITYGVYDNLLLHYENVQKMLRERPLTDMESYHMFQENIKQYEEEKLQHWNEYFDHIILHYTLNQIDKYQYDQVLEQCFKMLKKHGKLVVNLLLADEDSDGIKVNKASEELRTFPLEKEIMNYLIKQGFHGMKLDRKGSYPYLVVGGVELWPFTVEASKGKQGICLEQGHAVIYKGPFSEVKDDDGHVYLRGERMAVCAKTYDLLRKSPYTNSFIYLACYEDIPIEEAPLFDCNTPLIRHPHVTKGKESILKKGQEAECSTTTSDCC
ncbi:hypothetical protein [Bacillus alkalicellulosilyticus]|uniref:hypothetical protein n=1 Tax=Alkalihalobacterium alkalicellulosilyticum TaxID=1912214 RepID=UPI0009970334|nr:hypothetical protein [Bacillus alkalicellulosilyticus]